MVAVTGYWLVCKEKWKHPGFIALLFLYKKSKNILGAGHVSCAVSSFGQVSIMTRAKRFFRGFAARDFGLRPTPKYLAERKKENLWFPRKS